MLVALQSKLETGGEQIERQWRHLALRKLLSKLTFAGKAIMRRSGLPVLKRLVTNPEDAEKLTMLRHALRGLRRLLNSPEDVKNLSMMPRQFGAESLQLRPRQLLLLPLSTLEIWMSSAKTVARSDSWPNERSEVQRPVQVSLTVAKVEAYSTLPCSQIRHPFS